MLGWRTMLQLLARRAAESNAFSIRNALWSRVEDDLLVQAVAKHSTTDVLFRDWSEVALELPGRSEQQYKERYRLSQACSKCGGTDFCVAVCHFSWLPFLTILTRSHKRGRLCGFWTTSSL